MCLRALRSLCANVPSVLNVPSIPYNLHALVKNKDQIVLVCKIIHLFPVVKVDFKRIHPRIQKNIPTFYQIYIIVCDSNYYIEDCYGIKGNSTIIKFSCQRKSSELLNKKKKPKNLDIRKYDLNDGSRIYINESLCLYYRGLWEKMKRSLARQGYSFFLHD